MLIVQFSIFRDIFIYTYNKHSRQNVCLCKQLNMEIFFYVTPRKTFDRRNKEICKWRRSQSTVSQRFNRRCGLTSIALVLAFTYSRYNSSYFFPSLIELYIVKNFRLRAHLSNRAKSSKLFNRVMNISSWPQLRCPWKFMPNNSPPGISESFTSRNYHA